MGSWKILFFSRKLLFQNILKECKTFIYWHGQYINVKFTYTIIQLIEGHIVIHVLWSLFGIPGGPSFFSGLVPLTFYGFFRTRLISVVRNPKQSYKQRNKSKVIYTFIVLSDTNIYTIFTKKQLFTTYNT
jgi:hypothetical protein